MINGLEVARDAAVMLDYTKRQASLLHLIDHIRANLSHSCQFSASVHLPFKTVYASVCVCVFVCAQTRCLVFFEHRLQASTIVSLCPLIFSPYFEH